MVWKRKKYLRTNFSTKPKRKVYKKTINRKSPQKQKYLHIANFYNSLQHPEKYVGADKIITIRSSYEIKYAIMLDNDPRVLEWSSEDKEYVMKYEFPYSYYQGIIIETKKRIRNYYTDFYKKFIDDDGKIKEWIVEIKPYCQTIEPVETPNKSKKSYNYELFEYEKNQAKWSATHKFCAEERKKGRKIYFRILTEKDLI